MLSISEQNVLEEICKSSKSALLDIHNVISRVYDDELALDLNRQAARYSRLQEKAVDRLLDKGVIPPPIGIVDRTKRWAAIQAGTALNVSTGHIADMMVKENGQRLDHVLTSVKENEVTSSMAYELAEEFMDFEQENIRILKSYIEK